MKYILILGALLFTGCTAFKKMSMSGAENPYPNAAASTQRGEKLYQQHCLRCHGEKAIGPAVWTQGKKPANLIEILGEKKAWVLLANIKYGKNVKKNGEGMPAFKEVLTENQIWDIINYLNKLSTATKN